MRITGGREKGRILDSPAGLAIRPTSDRVREAVFNILGQNLAGISVLDLFAGSGSLALEALSRGAQKAVLVDNSRRSVSTIKKNLAKCGFQHKAVVLRFDLRKGLPGRRRELLNNQFDLVFLDPPYKTRLLPSLIEALLSRQILAKGARIVAESSRTQHPETAVENPQLQLTTSRLYGDTRISIFHREEEL
jgi:16S rRNA (guanine966-N2)-methyltransferase